MKPAIQEAAGILAAGYTSSITNLLTNSAKCKWNDVSFVIGQNGRIFHGMKAMFAMHSPVFELRELAFICKWLVHCVSV